MRIRFNVRSSDRVAGLDLLRSAAIIMVVLYHLPKPHSWTWLRATTHFGWIGVDLFFVLSGYLIAGQYFSSMARGRQTSLVLFYARRFLRTLPNYYIMLLLTVAALIYAKQLQGSLHIGRFFLFVQNFGVPPVFSISWSLCIEEHFYLVFPLIVLAIAKWGNSTVSKTVLLSIIGGGLFLRSWLWFHYSLHQAADASAAWGIYLGKIYYPTYTRLDGLTLGVGTAAIRYFRPDIWIGLVKRANILFLSGSALLAAALLISLNQFGVATCVFVFPMLAASFALILVASTNPESWVGSLRVPGAHLIALLSYSIYLTHLSAFSLGSSLASIIRANEIMKLPLFLLMAALTAFALHYAVERPFLRLRDRISITRSRQSTTDGSSLTTSTALSSASVRA